MAIIMVRYNGPPAGRTWVSEKFDLDQGHSQAKLGSCFELFLNGIRQERQKDSDDKLVIGHTAEGLPFQIIVDGFWGGATQEIHRFIDTWVTPLIDQYARELKAPASNPDVITKELIRRIYWLRQQFAIAAEFTMSVAVTYEKEGELFCSGFGIGDTAIAIKRVVDGVIDQLVTNNEVNDFKDAFDKYCSDSDNIELVIARNSVFTQRVSPGDELVGYTYLHEGIEIVAGEFVTDALRPSDAQPRERVKKYSLNPQLIHPGASLFDNLIRLNEQRHQVLFNEACQKDGQQEFGDDTTFGQVIIPSLAVRQQFIEYQFNRARLSL